MGGEGKHLTRRRKGVGVRFSEVDRPLGGWLGGGRLGRGGGQNGDFLDPTVLYFVHSRCSRFGRSFQGAVWELAYTQKLTPSDKSWLIGNWVGCMERSPRPRNPGEIFVVDGKTRTVTATWKTTHFPQTTMITLELPSKQCLHRDRSTCKHQISPRNSRGFRKRYQHRDSPYNPIARARRDLNIFQTGVFTNTVTPKKPSVGLPARARG